MENILLYLVLLAGGYFAGMAVNLIIDWLYERRDVFDSAFAEERETKGWASYLFWPFGFHNGEKRFKTRGIIVNFLFCVVVPFLWVSPPEHVEFWWGLPVLMYFAIVIIMDLEFRIVMHSISIAGVLLGSLVGIYVHGSNLEAMIITALGGVVGFVSMFVLFKLGEIFMRIVNNRRSAEIDEVALGFGDVNMAGVVGLFLGWPPVVLGLFFAIFVGGVVSILFVVVMLISKKFQAFSALPYAPFLAIAALVMLFFPSQVVSLLGL